MAWRLQVVRALLLAVLSLPALAGAQEPTAPEESGDVRVFVPEQPPLIVAGDIWLEAGGGRGLTDRPWVVGPYWEGVARLGVGVSQSSRVELEYTTGQGDVRRGTSKVRLTSLRVAWMTALVPTEQLTAYISLAMGGFVWRIENPDGVHPDVPEQRLELLGAFGPGLRFAITPFLALRSDFRSLSLITGKSWANFEWTTTLEVRVFRSRKAAGGPEPTSAVQ